MLHSHKNQEIDPVTGQAQHKGVGTKIKEALGINKHGHAGHAADETLVAAPMAQSTDNFSTTSTAGTTVASLPAVMSPAVVTTTTTATVPLVNQTTQLTADLQRLSVAEPVIIKHDAVVKTEAPLIIREAESYTVAQAEVLQEAPEFVAVAPERVREAAIVHEKPVITERTIVHERPVITEQPIIIEKDVIIEKNIVHEKDIIHKEVPIVRETHVTKEIPVVREVPVVHEQPIVRETHTIQETPVTTVTDVFVERQDVLDRSATIVEKEPTRVEVASTVVERIDAPAVITDTMTVVEPVMTTANVVTEPLLMADPAFQTNTLLTDTVAQVPPASGIAPIGVAAGAPTDAGMLTGPTLLQETPVHQDAHLHDKHHEKKHHGGLGKLLHFGKDKHAV